jgi:Flp pilus assembly protein TadG
MRHFGVERRRETFVSGNGALHASIVVPVSFGGTVRNRNFVSDEDQELRMKNARRLTRQRGGAVVEMGLIFAPLMFMFLSTLELGRGMWLYHTLSASLKTGTRFAAVHGADCVEVSASCQASLSDIAQTIRRAGVGLDASQLKLTFVAGSNTQVCPSLADCQTSAQWPPPPDNAAGLPVTITGVYSFGSVLSSLWPGQTSASFKYVAAATEAIQF